LTTAAILSVLVLAASLPSCQRASSKGQEAGVLYAADEPKKDAPPAAAPAKAESTAAAPQKAESAAPEKKYPPLDPTKGAVEGKVVLEGDPPVLKPLDVSPSNKDHAACASHVRDDRLLVGKDNAVKDAVISVAGYKPAEKVEPRVITLSNEGCSFVPRIQATTAGSKLKVTNSDPFLHNTHALLSNDFNNAIAKGDELEKKLPKIGMMLMTCDLHPWMQGRIHVFAHDLFDASGADGAYKIVNIPPGEYEIELWHEVLEGGKQKVKVEAGKTVKLDLVLKARQAKK
jgi:plastocyanin